jgi:hypothetical protein
MEGNPVSSAALSMGGGETNTEELEKDTSEGPIVRRERISLSSEDLRRHAVCQLTTSPDSPLAY